MVGNYYGVQYTQGSVLLSHSIFKHDISLINSAAWGRRVGGWGVCVGGGGVSFRAAALSAPWSLCCPKCPLVPHQLCATDVKQCIQGEAIKGGHLTPPISIARQLSI